MRTTRAPCTPGRCRRACPVREGGPHVDRLGRAQHVLAHGTTGRDVGLARGLDGRDPERSHGPDDLLERRPAELARRDLAPAPLGLHRAVRVDARERGPQHAVAHAPACEPREGEGQPVLDVLLLQHETHVERVLREPAGCVLEQADQVVELDVGTTPAAGATLRFRRADGGTGRQRERCADERPDRLALLARLAGPGERGVVVAERPRDSERARREVPLVDRLERVLHDDVLARGAPVGRGGHPVQRVEQLRHGDRGRARRPGALVRTGVHDDEVVARCGDGVEEDLPVLAARVALADLGVPGEQVVARGRGGAGNTPSSSPRRHTTRCGTERIGSSEQTVSAPVRNPARVGRPARWSSSSARTSASRSATAVRGTRRPDVAQHAARGADLPRLRRRCLRQERQRAVEGVEPVHERVHAVETA